MIDFRRMPKSFTALVERCKKTPSTRAEMEKEFHLLERTFRYGSGDDSVYLVLNRCHTPKGYHWFGFIMAPVAGDLEQPLIAYKDWDAERNLLAARVREELLRLEPGMVEAVEPAGEGLTFRGPHTARA